MHIRMHRRRSQGAGGLWPPNILLLCIKELTVVTKTDI